MKVSVDWILELLGPAPLLGRSKPAVDPVAEIARRLTGAGLEVEAIVRQSDAFEGVVAAEVRALEPHPDAAKLQIATVWDGAIERRIVCGAPNVAVGQVVPLAKLGAKLAGGLTIAPREIRGVPSEGMLCAADELGLSSDHSGLLLLAEGTKPGMPLSRVLGKEDVILELAPPANRPDLLSHLGVARELAALFGRALPELEERVKGVGIAASARASVHVEDLERCPRYLARVIEGVRVGPSPEWLTRRLEAIGQRSISNVVDVTNLVLMELGHPLHAFDLDRLEGHKIVVRRAQAGERIATLDGVTRALDEDDLVIADEVRPVALAGVMGGADSEVVPKTTRILLECALFEPRGVRRTGKRHGLHTEASHRFERGADPRVLELALDRAARLIAEIAGGDVAKGVLSAGKRRGRALTVDLRPARASLVLGRPVERAEIRRTLEGLGLVRVKPSKKTEAERFEIPSWRLDLSREEDLIEELARIGGFDAIPTVLPGGGGEVTARPARLPPEEIARAALVAEGYHEAISLAFASPSLVDACGMARDDMVEIANPLGEESGLLRPSLVPALLRAARHNQANARLDVRLFEIGRTFRWRFVAGEELPDESARVAILLRGPRGAPGWWGGREGADLYDLKGALEALLESLGVLDASYSAIERPFLHPRAAGQIVLSEEKVGWFGELHPDVAARLELGGPPIFIAELQLDRLAQARGPGPKMRPIPRFPSVSRDVSFFVDRAAPASKLVETVRRAGGPALEKAEIFDLYEGANVAPGQKSLAVALTFRAADRTLTDAEVDVAFGAVMTALAETHAAQIRKA